MKKKKKTEHPYEIYLHIKHLCEIYLHIKHLYIKASLKFEISGQNQRNLYS